MDKTFIRYLDTLSKGQCGEFYFGRDPREDSALFAYMHGLYREGKAKLCVIGEDERHAPCPLDFNEAAKGNSFHIRMLESGPNADWFLKRPLEPRK